MATACQNRDFFKFTVALRHGAVIVIRRHTGKYQDSHFDSPLDDQECSSFLPCRIISFPNA